jgi:hypothetical protein
MPSASHRFIPPAAVPPNGQPALVLPSGRKASCAIGSHVDVEVGQARLSQANWIDLGEVGSTSSRPTPTPNAELGRQYIDTTLGGGEGTLIVWNGSAWVGLDGGAV